MMPLLTLLTRPWARNVALAVLVLGLLVGFKAWYDHRIAREALLTERLQQKEAEAAVLLAENFTLKESAAASDTVFRTDTVKLVTVVQRYDSAKARLTPVDTVTDVAVLQEAVAQRDSVIATADSVKTQCLLTVGSCTIALEAERAVSANLQRQRDNALDQLRIVKDMDTNRPLVELRPGMSLGLGVPLTGEKRRVVPVFTIGVNASVNLKFW